MDNTNTNPNSNPSHLMGIGVDVCSVARIQTLWDDGKAERLIKRVCTEAEQTRGVDALQLAKIWAMKEAVSKALGTGIGAALSFQNIETSQLPSGQPQVRVPATWGASLHISYSTEDGLVTAFAIAQKGV